jgi:hypothetical protein
MHLPVWVAMLGIKPGIANQAIFGDIQGLYVWAAGCAQTESDFRQFVEKDVARRGLSLGEVLHVMPAESAMKNRRGADADWEALIVGAKQTQGIFLDSTYYFYEESD